MTSKKQKHQNSHHTPVLLASVLELISPQPGESYLDLTAGYGGHSSAIINATQNPKGATLIDRDLHACKELKKLQYKHPGKPRLINKNYLEACQQLHTDGEKFDLILGDLGVSSPQLDISDRGFSFNQEGPLDMRMDTSQAVTAAELVNHLDEERLANLLKLYGEEPHAKAIAKAIVAARPISTTTQLAEVVKSTIRRRGKQKIHPATRTFQALRIAVNDELRQLEQTLPLLVEMLTPNGRMAIISFHSLEDRIVKNFLKEQSSYGYEANLRLLNKKPIRGAVIDVLNPRARSATLRAAAKINTHHRKENANAN